MRKTRTGQPAPPSVRAGLLRAAKAPKSEEWKKQHSERLKRQWESGERVRHRVWTDDKIEKMRELKEQGKTDRQCAEIMVLTLHAIRSARQKGKTDARYAPLLNQD
jgi:hypothetical protein